MLTSLDDAPRKVNASSSSDVHPEAVITCTGPGLALTCVVTGVLIVTVSLVWERITADTPSNVTEVISLPVPRVQPEMVTSKDDIPATLLGRTLSIIPTEDWKLGERVGFIDGFVVGYPNGGGEDWIGGDVGTTVGAKVALVKLRQDADGVHVITCVAMILSSFSLDCPRQPEQSVSHVLPVIFNSVVPEGRLVAANT